MTTKLYWITIVAFVAAGIIAATCTGCATTSAMSDAIAGMFEANPDAILIPSDEDGDGTADVMLAGEEVNGQVVPKRDNQGQPIEVPESRRILAEAASLDTAAGATLGLWGQILGVPLVGGLGALIGRYKPAKRFTTGAAMFTELVHDIQKWRNSPNTPPAAIAVDFDGAMKDLQSPVLRAEIWKVKVKQPPKT